MGTITVKEYIQPNGDTRDQVLTFPDPVCEAAKNMEISYENITGVITAIYILPSWLDPDEEELAMAQGSDLESIKETIARMVVKLSKQKEEEKKNNA